MKLDVAWPEGKRFAFTVFDDTDHTTLSNGPEVYRMLEDLGMRTTKSVWPVAGPDVPKVGGTTCNDEAYAAWVRDLQVRGFEIALHNATYHSSPRGRTVHALDVFRRLFGAYPKIHVNHADCNDSIYWGASRLTGPQRTLYRVLTRDHARGLDGGTTEGSEYFWGDLCKEHVTYVRNFVFRDINTLKRCPQMPYHDPARPYVNYWFAGSEGPNRASFCETIAEEHQDRLEAEGGACIMYTHFGAADFYDGGRLNARFVHLMTRLAEKGGWFVPVSELLDHLRSRRTDNVITPRERDTLERRWLFEKVFVTRGTT